MAKDKAYRKYQLTFNNPTEHGFSHEHIRSILGTFTNCLYWCMCDEIGEQQTPHTHLYICFKNAVLFSTIHQRFYGAHIEGAKGTSQQNRDYVRKEGKWLDDAKHETSLPNTFEELGELPDERSPHKKASEAILDMIEEGATNDEILYAYPTTMNRLNHIDQARQTIMASTMRSTYRNMTCHYIWGATGVGKTRYVMEKYGYENVYRVTNYKNPFDGYEGQKVILFDEFRSSLPIEDMLKYLDGYPIMLPCRYADRAACFETVYIVSNIPLEKQYTDIQLTEPETWSAFLRRISDCVEMVGDTAPDKEVASV